MKIDSATVEIAQNLSALSAAAAPGGVLPPRVNMKAKGNFSLHFPLCGLVFSSCTLSQASVCVGVSLPCKVPHRAFA